MFGKIMKYELKSSMKIFLIIWIGMIAVALAGGFMINNGTEQLSDNYFFFQNFSFELGGILQTITLILFIALSIGIVALSLIFIIQRFNKGLLGREGYLMFTLPTKPRTLIISKCASATIIVLLSILAGLISIVCFVLPSISGLDELKELFSTIGSFIAENSDRLQVAIPVMLMLILIGILGIISFIYQVYASISIGHLFDKHRMLMAVVAYVGISIATGVVESFLVNMAGSNIAFFQGDWNAGFGNPETLFMLAGVAAMQIIWIVVYHIVTELILRNRLNLE